MCFFFNDTATTEIYTLSLHDALPILLALHAGVLPLDRERPLVTGPVERPHELLEVDVAVPGGHEVPAAVRVAEVQVRAEDGTAADRKSTRLNSSHANISYAVFCLKKK